MEEDEWEDIDVNAVEECMLLATQLYAQPQAENNALTTTSELHNGRTTSTTNNSPQNQAKRPIKSIRSKNSFGVLGENKTTNNIDGENLVNVSGTKPISRGDKSNGPVSFTKQRFSELYSMSNSSGVGKSSGGRWKASQNQGKMYEPLPMNVALNQNTSHTPSTSQYHQRLFKKDNQEQERLLKKTEAEQTTFNEQIQRMQGETLLLRAELKRKDTALESERLDRIAAIEAAEKRGRQKAENMVAESEAKAKENKMLVDKLQGELHFKKIEMTELLNRCQRLERQNGQVNTPRKRARSELSSPTSSPNKTRTKLSARFDFVSGVLKLKDAEVQTESFTPQTRRRHMLPVAQSRGRGSSMQCTALLLSSDPTSTWNSVEGTSNHLPNEWSHIIAQSLVESEGREPWTRLVESAAERLQHIHSSITTSAEADRGDGASGDVMEWYEKSITGAVKVLDVGRRMCNPNQVLPLLTSHLPPHCIKDCEVNKRIRPEILQATEKVSLRISHPISKHLCDHLISAVRKLCECMEGSKEVTAVLRVVTALSHSALFISQLCSSGSCIIGVMCKKIRGVENGDMEVVRILLALVKNVIKHLPPWFSDSCNCPIYLLTTLITRSYHLLSQHPQKGSSELKKLVVMLVRVLHAWSVADSSWWGRQLGIAHYPVLMSLIPSAVPASMLDKHTVDQLCDLYDFDEGYLAGD